METEDIAFWIFVPLTCILSIATFCAAVCSFWQIFGPPPPPPRRLDPPPVEVLPPTTTSIKSYVKVETYRTGHRFVEWVSVDATTNCLKGPTFGWVRGQAGPIVFIIITA